MMYSEGGFGGELPGGSGEGLCANAPDHPAVGRELLCRWPANGLHTGWDVRKCPALRRKRVFALWSCGGPENGDWSGQRGLRRRPRRRPNAPRGQFWLILCFGDGGFNPTIRGEDTEIRVNVKNRVTDGSFNPTIRGEDTEIRV